MNANIADSILYRFPPCCATNDPHWRRRQKVLRNDTNLGFVCNIFSLQLRHLMIKIIIRIEKLFSIFS